MSNQVQAVKFYDDTLITLEKDGEHYVAVRPIVENMGLEWSGQQKKLISTPKFNCVDIYTVAQDGKTRKVLCIPVKKLNGWLFSINPEKVRADIRHIVEQYQEECFTVLHDYWHKGVAVNERMVVSTKADRVPLKDAVNLLVAKSGLNYSECYKLVHQYMNVGHIDEINTDRLPIATAYVHSLIVQCDNRSYRYLNASDERLVSRFDDEGHLWTRPLADDEYVVTINKLPQLLMTATDITHDELLAINYISSARLASGLKHLPSLVFSDSTKEV